MNSLGARRTARRDVFMAEPIALFDDLLSYAHMNCRSTSRHSPVEPFTTARSLHLSNLWPGNSAFAIGNAALFGAGSRDSH
jgi:hypothetical protein